MDVVLFDGKTVYQSFTFHSSCSKNLFIGDSFGAIQLLSFTNYDQGTVACTTMPFGGCKDLKKKFLWKVEYGNGLAEPETRNCAWLKKKEPCYIQAVCDSDLASFEYDSARNICSKICHSCPLSECPKEQCTERATEMKFEVTGNRCEMSVNTQDYKFSCEDDSANSMKFPLRVVMKSIKSPDEVYFLGTVWVKGEIITISNKGDKFDADMSVELLNISGKKLYQSVSYHSSCSKDLRLGDSFGAVRLVSFTNSQGTFECPLPGPTSEPIAPCPSEKPSSVPSGFPSYLPTMSSNSPSNNPTNIQSLKPTVWPTKVPSITPSKVSSVSPSETPTVIPSSSPSNRPSPKPSISLSYHPTASPTIIPSLIPSRVPSTLPSLKPSILASIVPTVSPSTPASPSPSIHSSLSPTMNCINDEIFLYKDKNGKDCEWVGEKEWRRKNLCANDRSVLQACPLICCYDVAKFIFPVLGKLRSCEWIKQNNKQIRCQDVHDGMLVSDMCPLACNKCRIPAFPTPAPSILPSISSIPSTDPSTIPSDDPTVKPSVVSSFRPSIQPSISPTTFCFDDYEFLHQHIIGQSCHWVGGDEIRRITLCSNNDEVLAACPRTCGCCPCRDNKTFTFVRKEETGE